MSTGSGSSASAAVGAALEQAIMQNPTWPNIPGKGKWAGLPVELQGTFAAMEDTIYKGTIQWWLNLVVIGALGFDMLVSLPSDIKFVFWPEIQRIFDFQNPDKSSRKWKLPHPIIIAHFFARLLVVPFMGVVCNYYRLPKDCNGSLHGMLFIIALMTINGQLLLTFRTLAISKSVPYHRFAWLFLLAGNLAVSVIWLMFAFETSATTSPATEPLGFRFGFNCSPPTSNKWMPTAFYAICFSMDTLMFILALMALNNTFSSPVHNRQKPDPIQSLRSMVDYTIWCLLGINNPHVEAFSAIAATFIADGARYLIFAWVLEGVGIVFAVRFVLTPANSDQVKMAWVLPFHALVYGALVPKTVVSLKRVSWIERMTAQRNAGEPLLNPFDSDPREGPKDRSGIAIRSIVQQHMEGEEHVNAETGAGGAFATYQPNLVESVQAYPPFSASGQREKDKDSLDESSYRAHTTEGATTGSEYPPPRHGLFLP